jgi:hypothetical protein
MDDRERAAGSILRLFGLRVFSSSRFLLFDSAHAVDRVWEEQLGSPNRTHIENRRVTRARRDGFDHWDGGQGSSGGGQYL